MNIMNEKDIELYNRKAALCRTFADAKRLMIINELRRGEKAAGELAELTGMNQAVVSRELSLMRSRGVVRPRRDGVKVYYSLSNYRIIEACDMVHQVLLAILEEDRDFTQSVMH
jgi:ArsR family transcriptional regulator